MATNRVQSKNLFQHLQLKGKYDNDVAYAHAQITQQSENADEAMKKIQELLTSQNTSTDEFVATWRHVLAEAFCACKLHPLLTSAVDKVTEKIIKVPTTHCGHFNVPVFQYTPNKFQEDVKAKSKKAAYVYAHGGGAFALDASMYKPLLAYYALELDVVVFNVDYRLAPETKCPNNVKDFYEVIKYVVKNADSLGIDASKIAIGGESGGGYICLGAMVLLAQNEESGLVKMAMPCIPMVDDYCFSDIAAMTEEEKESCLFNRRIWKELIAEDFEKQKSDPLLFPGKASDELLKKFVPTVMEEVEFDQYITEATRLANRLRRAGRLLDEIVVPGARHSSTHVPSFKCFQVAMDARKLAFQHYLHEVGVSVLQHKL